MSSIPISNHIQLFRMFWFQIITNILVATAALLGNYFVFKYYSISRTKLVSMLYSSIAVVDSIGSVTALLQVVSFLMVEVRNNGSRDRLNFVKISINFKC